MKRGLALVILTLLLGACAKDGSGGGAAKPSPGPAPQPNPDPHVHLEWGDLRCQEKRNCEEVALNVDFFELAEFLNRWTPSDRQGPVEERIFFCRRRLGQAWTSRFAGDGYDPSLDEFFLQVIDPEACAAQASPDMKLHSYFYQTGEYKNEIIKIRSGRR